jgi:Bacterial extracellular solute-binding proteins, family 5 Middle.
MSTDKTYVLLVVAVVMVVVAAYSVSIAQAQQKPQIVFPVAGTSWVIAPGTPIYNPYSPTTIAGCSIVGAMTYLPLAFYNSMTNSYLPVLADNWTVQVLPNGSGILTVHLRPGFYWFNGSATIPFTAWDAYARFYIGIKAFGWYRPYMLPQYADEDVRVIDNYTIQFLFQKWTALRLYYVLTTCMSTPWPVWEPIVNELKAMNTTQAIKFSDNITKFVVPYWGLFPYYLTYFSSNYMLITLEPSNLLSDWFRIFPLADWYYYDPTYEAIWGSNTVALESYLAGKGTWGSAGFSMQQVEVLEQHGIGVYFGPSFFTMGIAVNPHYYPWNIPQVREALCYVINRTETAEAWGLAISHPDYYPEPVVPEVIDTYPPDVRQFIIPCSYNWTKASQMLQSLGFYKKGGYWYTPNGTQLTLEVLAPSGYTDWMTMASDAVMQLQSFGINAKLVGQDVGVFFGTIVPNGQYEAITTGLGGGSSYYSVWVRLSNPWYWTGAAISAYTKGSNVWPFQWPNGTCTPVTAPHQCTYPTAPSCGALTQHSATLT